MNRPHLEEADLVSLSGRGDSSIEPRSRRDSRQGTARAPFPLIIITNVSLVSFLDRQFPWE